MNNHSPNVARQISRDCPNSGPDHPPFATDLCGFGSSRQLTQANIVEDGLRGVVARRAGDAATGMGSRSAHVETRDRRAVGAVPEHGPRGGDELNIIRKGANYGWPLVTHGINYNGTTISEDKSALGLEDPVVQWTPVIAASGLALYRGDKFPRWRGNLFAGGLAGQRLVRLELNGTSVAKQEILLRETGRIRDVRSFDDGFLYVVYDEPGKVVRLVPE